MSPPLPPHPALGRRGFIQLAAAGALVANGPALAARNPGPSETAAEITPQPAPRFADDATTADVLVETLCAWGATHVFGVVGDGINAIIEALRKRQDRIRYVGVRHEEAAAFMASGFAKHTGRLGVCIGTTGPGAIHLLNGPLRRCAGRRADAGADRIDVSRPRRRALPAGHRHHQAHAGRGAVQRRGDGTRARGDRRQSGVPRRARRARRRPSGDRQGRSDDAARGGQAFNAQSRRANLVVLGAAVRHAAERSVGCPADVLNTGARVAILAGQGALAARAEVTQVADLLGAPVAKALLGKAVLADDSPYSTGGIGNLGTAPSSWIMKACDTLLILGSTMPWEEYYPTPGQARGVQVDLKPDRLGLRFPVEVGLAADVRATLQGLLPLLRRKDDRSFLDQAQRRMTDWNTLLEQVEAESRTPLRPQMVIRALSEMLADDAVISLDCGANTHFAARCLRLRENQRLTGTGMLASMAPGLPYAIAAQLAFPGRQSVAVVGDGGFAMLMAEFTTAVANQLPVKIVVLKNDSLAEVKFEQREIGNPEYGCDLAPIDFVAFARACGAEGFRCAQADEIRPALDAALRSPKPALVEAVVDANEKPTKPDQLKV